jgi:hypothetical protein
VVQGNYLGTNAAGTAALPNHLRGVGISYGASGNTVGGTTAAARNLISGNLQNGVLLDARTDSNVVQGNYIGTDVTGTQAVPNHQEGVLLGKTSVAGAITNNLIGGTDPGAGNLISGNLREGVRIKDPDTSGNRVQGNYIGIDVTGAATLPNGRQGVFLQQGATGNVIGGTDPAAGNLISGNGLEGVAIKDSGTSGNLVQGNRIGTDVTGAVALGNSGDGVFIGAPNNTVGGTVAGAGNVISANGGSGITLSGSSATGTLVLGNFIGTDVSGTAPLGNALDGVRIVNTASSNTIGTTDSGAGNTIAFNGGSGVRVGLTGTDLAVHNSIRGNSIFANGALGIDLGGDGVTPNHEGDPGPGPNGWQNYPVLQTAQAGDSTQVTGTLNGRPNTTYTLDFYASATADPSGYGQGQRYLDSVTVTTDAFGNAVFDVTLLAATNPGEVLSATSTDPDGNTSEFSAVLTL